MKFCKDCKYASGVEDSAKCLHPDVSGKRYNLVTGEHQPWHCATERGQATGTACPCGADGALYEEKAAQ